MVGGKTGSLVKAREERKGSWSTECAENTLDNGKTERARAKANGPTSGERVKHSSLIRSRGERRGIARFVRIARGREDAIQGQTANGDESQEKTATMKTFGEGRSERERERGEGEGERGPG